MKYMFQLKTYLAMFYFIIGKNIHDFYPGVYLLKFKKEICCLHVHYMYKHLSTSVMRIDFFQPWLHNVF